MSSSKRPGIRLRTAREIARHAERILEEAAAAARQFEKQGIRSATLSRAELMRKLSGKTAHSPFLTQVGWGNAVRGSTFALRFGIMNPDPRPYDEATLAMCVYWGPGTGVADPGESLLAADQAFGVRAVNLGILNPSPSLQFIIADHVLPTGLAAGASRSDVSYLLYSVNAMDAGIVLERGSLSVAIA
jgi:hypothetical protein